LKAQGDDEGGGQEKCFEGGGSKRQRDTWENCGKGDQEDAEKEKRGDLVKKTRTFNRKEKKG